MISEKSMSKRSRITLVDLQKIAERKGGKCLSEKYLRNSDKYQWKCSLKHEWKASWANIRAGTWCPTCPRGKYTISDLRKHASNKDGKCLSDIYHGYHELHEWQCFKEHTWNASWTNVKSGGTWCPQCHKEKYSISDLKSHASLKGGKCLSEEYTGANDLYEWKCSEGHRWYTTWSNVKYNNTWCGECQKLSLEIAQEMAEDRGGRCLSEIYHNNKTNMLWECLKGHRWESTLGSVRDQDAWCIICQGRKLELSHAQNIAHERRGKCLSNRYVNCKSFLKWRCDKNHTWQATLDSVKHSNRWCPKCWKIKIQPTIDQLNKIAQSHSGKLLSTVYKNNTTKMKWRCKEGHEWLSSSASVKNSGSWCPNCRYLSERMCREILEDIFSYLPECLFHKCRPKFLQLTKKQNSCLELDGYNPSLNLAFEYQGLQHYQYVPFFHRNGIKDLKKTQERDAIKRERCAKNGIDLIEIPHTYTYQDPDELRCFIIEAVLSFETRRGCIWTNPDSIRRNEPKVNEN